MDRERSLETILTLVGASIILFFIFKLNLFLFIGLALACSAILSQKISRWIAAIWLTWTQRLGVVISRILLGLVFFLILVPFAFLAKLFGHKALLLSRKKEDSYFIARDHIYVDRDLKNPW